jgi:predicted lipase
MNNSLDLEFSLVNEMLSLACLVYDCNKELKLKKEKNNFTINNLNIESLKISNTRKNILRDLFKLYENDNYNIIKLFDINGLQVGIILNHSDKRINVVFRGSDELSDWLHNFFIFKKNINNNIKVNNIKVHSGFYKLLFNNNLYTDILNEIKKLTNQYTDYTLNVTGHSLGGALATLFGFFLSYSITSKIYIFSFASPRVGNRIWANIFNNKENLIHYRFVNQKDIVTAIPYFYYSHCGNYININKNSSLHVINKQDYKDINSIINYYSARDHNIDKYYINFNLCYNIKI